MKNKTTVLYIVESFSTGVYSVIHSIATNLDPLLFDLHILHSLRSDSPSDYSEQFGPYEHVKLTYVPMDSLSAYLSAMNVIRKTVRKEQPDVIHLHSSKAGFLARVALLLTNHRLLYSPHGFSFLRQDVSPLKRSLFLTLERLAQKLNPAQIIAVSEEEGRVAGKITDSVQVIPNFIDIDALPSLSSGSEGFVITSGRISAQKNPRLFNLIAQAFPSTEFIWVGDGPERGLLTEKNIRVTGYVSREEVYSFLASASLYLHTSLWEGMPVSIIEAMALGKAVVASDIIGNRELIVPGVTGYLCDPEDTGIFRARVKELLGDPVKRLAMGEAGSARIRDHYSLSGAIDSYTRLYTGQMD